MDFKGRARIHSHLDIAPLIDIVFLLLVFFMLTSTFVTPEAIELELPESSSAQSIDITPITVAINPLGELSINGQRIALTQLQNALVPLIAENSQTPITLKSDAETQVQQLLNVMDEIRQAGGTNIALATSQK
ncbi:MAG: biopolymer transporter ExbD [Thiomicrorhabdus sp.]|nr:biopolymer transporter ExbD [Thiomicrorhabdus sp.]